MIMEKLGQNHVTFPEESFHAFGCNYLLPDAFTHVHFHCHRNYLDTASLLHSLLGMSKGKNSRFTSSLESSAAHLNLIWTIKSFDSAETRVWGKGGNVWFKEGFRVEWRGGLLEIVQEPVSLWESCTSWFWLSQEIPQKSFWKLPRSLEDLSISILPLAHFCPGLVTDAQEREWISLKLLGYPGIVTGRLSQIVWTCVVWPGLVILATLVSNRKSNLEDPIRNQ